MKRLGRRVAPFFVVTIVRGKDNWTVRLDQAVAARHSEISRRKARELISARRVLVNDRVVGAASREVSESDRLTIVDAGTPPLRILGETADWIAVDKPAAMPATPTAGRKLRSLEELLRMNQRQLFVVHRLDTNTTGVILFAKSRAMAARLSQLFSNGEIEKRYLAVVHGVIDSEQTLATPIGGKRALTAVRPLASLPDRTLIEAIIHTGRTHQIRIHLSGAGHPLFGDRRYGTPGVRSGESSERKSMQTHASSPTASAGAPMTDAARPMLHAWRLSHPLFGLLESSPPDDLIRCAPPWSPAS